MMKRSILLLLIIGTLTITFFFLLTHAKNTPTQQHTIVLKEDGFSPSQVIISKGDSVVFKTARQSQFWPASDLHPTHDIYPEFDPQEPIDPEKSWTFRFTKSGTWHFHDHLSPYYRGIIVVK